MNELHTFFFEGLPVRGAVVRLQSGWQEVLERRAANGETGAFPARVNELLGEMAAASVLMHSNVQFDGALVLQIQGDGPVKLAVVESSVLPDTEPKSYSFRATAKVQGEVAADARLSDMVNVLGHARCAITLDPRKRLPGQQAYQATVGFKGDRGEKIESMSQVLAHYMLQSEQLDTVLVLAADEQTAAGLLLQRMPREGEKNLGDKDADPTQEQVQREGAIGRDEDFNRLAILAESLKREELLELPALDVLHRLFWEEKLLRREPVAPRFACSCSRERVGNMLKSLGAAEVESVIAERGEVEVGCDFCGQQYRFDPVDAAQVFVSAADLSGGAASVQ
jgi:molecular chaperone Hsp33